MIFFAKLMKSFLPVIVWFTATSLPSIYSRKRDTELFSKLFLTKEKPQSRYFYLFAKGHTLPLIFL